MRGITHPAPGGNIGRQRPSRQPPARFGPGPRSGRSLALGLALLASACGAPPAGTFVGTVTDETCPDGNHAHMRMGETDAECTTACVLAHGVRYALYDGSRTYVLNGHRDVESFAAQRVTVTGRLDAASMTIDVESIAPAR